MAKMSTSDVVFDKNTKGYRLAIAKHENSSISIIKLVDKKKKDEIHIILTPMEHFLPDGTKINDIQFHITEDEIDS